MSGTGIFQHQAEAGRPLDGRPRSGVVDVLAFNWPSFVGAGLAIGGGVSAGITAGWPPWVGVLGWLVAGCALHLSVGSLWCARRLYDRADVREWAILPRVLRRSARDWAHVHAGLDRSSPALRRLFPAGRGTVIELYDPSCMTEPSMQRARRLAQRGAEMPANDAGRLPLESASVDAVFLLFAAHEVRVEAKRLALLMEARRALRADGRVVLVEHDRDWRNVLAFGPGALHFYPARHWRQLAGNAGLIIERAEPIAGLAFCLVLSKKERGERS